MRTAEKYKEMGYIELSPTKIQDKFDKIYYPKKATSSLKAIRKFCGECMGMDRGSKNPPWPFDDVQKCTDPMCPLFDFRLGKNPFLKRVLTQEQKNELRDRMKLINRP